MLEVEGGCVEDALKLKHFRVGDGEARTSNLEDVLGRRS